MNLVCPLVIYQLTNKKLGLVLEFIGLFFFWLVFKSGRHRLFNLLIALKMMSTKKRLQNSKQEIIRKSQITSVGWMIQLLKPTLLGNSLRFSDMYTRASKWKNTTLIYLSLWYTQVASTVTNRWKKFGSLRSVSKFPWQHWGLVSNPE